MTTANITLTGDWSLLVNDGDNFWLSVPYSRQPLALALCDTDSPPSGNLAGHRLNPVDNNWLTREMSGPGYLYARSIDPAASILLTLTAWTPNESMQLLPPPSALPDGTMIQVINGHWVVLP